MAPTTPTEPVSLEISPHCVRRWHERVKPGLSLRQAEAELVRHLEQFATWGDRPEWLPAGEESAASSWLWLGDSIALPVQRGCVLSCLVRGTFAPRVRRVITDFNKFDRRARRAREDPATRRRQGKAAKANRKRNRRWSPDEEAA
jgi:hypothetical protein